MEALVPLVGELLRLAATLDGDARQRGEDLEGLDGGIGEGALVVAVCREHAKDVGAAPDHHAGRGVQPLQVKRTRFAGCEVSIKRRGAASLAAQDRGSMATEGGRVVQIGRRGRPAVAGPDPDLIPRRQPLEYDGERDVEALGGQPGCLLQERIEGQVAPQPGNLTGDGDRKRDRGGAPHPGTLLYLVPIH
jgi:hypothetical protein